MKGKKLIPLLIASVLMVQPVYAQENGMPDDTGSVQAEVQQDEAIPDASADGIMGLEAEPQEVTGEEDTSDTGAVFNVEAGDENGDPAEEEAGETVLVGWVTEDGQTFYYNVDGTKCTGEKKIEGKWYYFDAVTGAMQTGVVVLEKKTVCYGSDGAMLYGLSEYEGVTYYLDSRTGAMQYGEKKIDGKWYYFDKNTGAMRTGIVKLESKTVCYGADGAMRYGEQKVNGKWYYFDTRTGAMKTGIVKLASKTVYYGPDGAMRYGEQKVNGKWYYFDTRTGAMRTGLVQLPGKTVYYGSDGAMRYGEQKVNGKWRYFDKKTGAMKTDEFVDLGSKVVYYDSEGAMVYGWIQMEHEEENGDVFVDEYYFDTRTGAMAFGLQEIDGTVYFFDRTYGYRIDMLTTEEAMNNADLFWLEMGYSEAEDYYVYAEGPYEAEDFEYPQYIAVLLKQNQDVVDVVDVVAVDAVTGDVVQVEYQ